MKTLFGLLLMTLMPSLLVAQDAKVPFDSLFIVTYTTGPSWDPGKAPGDQLYFKDHSVNLGNWRKDGLIKFGARYAQKGIIFLLAPDMASARRRVEGDPAVINGLFVADVQPLVPFYYGCIEKVR